MLSVYIHIPFCMRKCNYCDFLSFPCQPDSAIEEYVKALIEQINSYEATKEPVKTIFIGGGTPSYISPQYIEAIVAALRNKFYIYKNAEFTIEANPGTLTRQKLILYRKCGINRLSIGLQATQQHLLDKLGRIHTNMEFLKSFMLARECGFENINVDLMFALPSQTLDEWQASVKSVCALAPEHISAYSLIIEEGTPFYDMKLDLPDEILDREMYHFAVDYLAENGYKRYETSNFAKPSMECKHNLVYWDRGNYIGFGLGAASLIDNIRYKCTTDMNEYLKGNYISERESLSVSDQMSEFAFLGLRKADGISITDFKRQFKKDIFSVYDEAISKHIYDGLLIRNGDRIYLSDKGNDLANMVLVDFLL